MSSWFRPLDRGLRCYDRSGPRSFALRPRPVAARWRPTCCGRAADRATGGDVGCTIMSVLTVGFDLDMTLVDSRPGIAATYRVLSQRTGVAIDTDLVVSRLGPPLVHEMAHWFPAEQVAEAVEEYRALYSDHAIAPTVPLPGAVDALAAVRAAGGRVVVVTSKLGRLARLHLEHHGFVVDAVAGDRWADGKTASTCTWATTSRTWPRRATCAPPSESPPVPARPPS